MKTKIKRFIKKWLHGEWLMDYDNVLYAADLESEVALLNRKPVPLNSGEAYSSEVVRVNQKPKGRFNINLDQLASDLKEQGKQDREMLTGEPPDKDALIRELVAALQGAKDDFERIKSNPGWQDRETGYMSGHIANGAIILINRTLARTTCPEAFDGCNETPVDGR